MLKSIAIVAAIFGFTVQAQAKALPTLTTSNIQLTHGGIVVTNAANGMSMIIDPNSDDSVIGDIVDCASAGKNAKISYRPENDSVVEAVSARCVK